jgi:hypothetical protein
MWVFQHTLYVDVCPNPQTVRQCAASLGVTANQIIIPIMRAAERVPVTSKEAYALWNWIGPRCVHISHLKRTVPGFVWKRTKTSCSGRSRSADLGPIEVSWLHSHQRNRTEPRDQTRLVRTKCCWYESTNKLLKQKYRHYRQ